MPTRSATLLGTWIAKLVTPVGASWRVARLQAGLGGPLTLLSAPPGCGKTTLLAAWRATPAGRAVPLAWVSLDAADNDPALFWAYVATALDRVHRGAGALALLRIPQPPTEAVPTALLQALDAVPVDTVLALDDYHVIAVEPIHRGLAFLLDHLPPRLHLLLATRADPPPPMARLRARGLLTELRANDLRFTPREAAAFLTEAMGLPLTEREVAALEARTEGWVAGLQLAALSLRGRPAASTAAFIAAFAGSHRHVVDYLLEEVLLRQPDEVQAFLLRTCILDRLCAALLGDESKPVGGEAASQAALERLERANVFVIPLDEERRWYRYHHLFADALRQRITSGARRAEVPILYGRASAWFEQQGLLQEAIRHALAGEQFERAARLMEQTAWALYGQGGLRSPPATATAWVGAWSAPGLRPAHVPDWRHGAPGAWRPRHPGHERRATWSIASGSRDTSIRRGRSGSTA